jgi:hypothetical protein
MNWRTSEMLGPEDRIMDKFYTNYPDLDKHSADRYCVADVLEFVLEEFAYKPALYGNAVVDVADIASLIDTLRDTVTIEELSQDDSTASQDAL